MAFLKNFRPWFVAISLTMAELNRLGFDAELGIDEHFRRQAGSTKRLSSIESVDSQVALFTSLSSETQEDNLEQALDEIDALGPEMAKAIELWKRGDAAGLEKLLIDPMRSQYPDLFHRLFVERNVKMADAVETLLAEPGSHFVIVGGGHLVGDQGVIDLLTRRGHDVVQLAASHAAPIASAAPATQ
jgi:uncharacterized protein YbaP (TraB family)